jgi:IS30 family transposase
LARKKAEGLILGRPYGRRETALKLMKRKEEIEKYISLGMSASQIGRAIGAHRLTVTHFLRDQDMETQRKAKPNVPKRLLPYKEIIRECIECGMIYEEIKTVINDAGFDDFKIGTLRNFITEDKELYILFTQVQDNRRVEVNGGLIISESGKEYHKKKAMQLLK